MSSGVETGSGSFRSPTTIHDNEPQTYATPSPPPLPHSPLPSVLTHIVFPNFPALPALEILIPIDTLPVRTFSAVFSARFPTLARGHAEAEQDVHLQFHFPCPEPVFNDDPDLGSQRCHGRIPFCRYRYTRRSRPAELYGGWAGTWRCRRWVWV